MLLFIDCLLLLFIVIVIVQIHENEVWRDEDQSELLKHKFKESQYPPRIILHVSCDKSAVSEMIKFTLHYSGIQETVFSKDCDKKIKFQANSSWLNNIHSSKCVKFIVANSYLAT